MDASYYKHPRLSHGWSAVIDVPKECQQLAEEEEDVALKDRTMAKKNVAICRVGLAMKYENGETTGPFWEHVLPPFAKHNASRYTMGKTADKDRCVIDEHVFLSGERGHIISHLEGLRLEDPLRRQFRVHQEQLNLTREELEKRTKYLCSNRSLNDKFSHNCAKDFYAHYDCAERQILSTMFYTGKEMTAVCRRLLDHSNGNRICEILVTLFIHSRMDPCPLCVDALVEIFSQSNLLSEPLGSAKCSVYVVPVISSRLDYGLRRDEAAPWVLDWVSSDIDLGKFRLYNSAGERVVESIPLVFYKVPISELRCVVDK